MNYPKLPSGWAKLGFPGAVVFVLLVTVSQLKFTFPTVPESFTGWIVLVVIGVVGGLTFFVLHRCTPKRAGRITVSERAVIDPIIAKRFESIAPRAPLPTVDHVCCFLEEPSSQGLLADSMEEAFVMAYVEKHMGNFSSGGRPIGQMKDRNAKRDAIVAMVKKIGVEETVRLIRQHCPPVMQRA